jgi:hypothetical protein
MDSEVGVVLPRHEANVLESEQVAQTLWQFAERNASIAA